MRDLKKTIPQQAKTSTAHSIDHARDESITFNRALKSLETLIRKKLDENPMSRGTLIAVLWKEQGALIERLTAHLQNREINRLIRRVQQVISRQDAERDQYLLPGFEALPKRITTAGKQQRLASATYMEVFEYLEALEQKQKENPRITQTRALLARMEKYRKAFPEITVREVCERER